MAVSFQVLSNSSSVDDITYFIAVAVYCIVYLFCININLFNCSLIVFVVVVIVIALHSLCVVCPLLFV
jgi:hypothetical protein